MTELSDEARLEALERTALLDTPAERAFDRLTALVARELGVPVSLVSLVTSDRQFFKSQCGLVSPWAERRGTPLSHSFCQHVVTTEEALIVVDAERDPRVEGNLAIGDLGVAAYAGFPLTTSSGEVLGSFCAIDTVPREWSSRDLELLREMAGAAMDIIELREEAVSAADAAQRLQRALVLEPPPLTLGRAWSAYRPGDLRLLLGGDFYLCAEPGDGSIAVLIGDVAGHGPEAAGFAAALRAAWSALLQTEGSLPELVSRLNDLACQQRPDGQGYATALFGRLNPERMTAEIVNAGHPPPVLLTGGLAAPVGAAHGPPLGVIDGQEWDRMEFEVPAGAALLVYTDGLTEARLRADHGLLGVERVLAELERLLEEGADGVALLDGLFALATQDAAAADDIAALLVRPGAG